MTFGEFLGVILIVIVLIVLVAVFLHGGLHAVLVALAILGGTIVILFFCAAVANSNN